LEDRPLVDSSFQAHFSWERITAEKINHSASEERPGFAVLWVLFYLFFCLFLLRSSRFPAPPPTPTEKRGGENEIKRAKRKVKNKKTHASLILSPGALPPSPFFVGSLSSPPNIS
jgi:hypothetical protein